MTYLLPGKSTSRPAIRDTGGLAGQSRVMQHHGEIGRAVEIAAASVWEPLGPPPQEGTKAINAWRSAMRDQVNGLAQLLEARALGKEASEEPPIEGPTDG